MMKSIHNTSEFKQVTNQDKPSVMVFSADWCPDCRFLDTYIDDVVREYHGRLEFYAVDRDEHAELCDSLDVLGIPSFIVYQNGQEVDRFVNSKRKFKPEVLAFLNQVEKDVEVRK